MYVMYDKMIRRSDDASLNDVRKTLFNLVQQKRSSRSELISFIFLIQRLGMNDMIWYGIELK